MTKIFLFATALKSLNFMFQNLAQHFHIPSEENLGKTRNIGEAENSPDVKILTL